MSTASWQVTDGSTETGASKLRQATFSLLHLQIKSVERNDVQVMHTAGAPKLQDY